MTPVIPDHLSLDYVLTADQTNAQGEMPLWLIASRVIHAATLHANALGIGYSALITHGIGWVLSRLSIEMERYPGINESFTLTTWIEGYNRYFSDRCFAITDASGEEIGHIRTQWMAIDMKTRTMAMLDQLDRNLFPVYPKECPVTPMKKVRALPDDAKTQSYTFSYDDIDFNRHVNTVQYVRLILNQWNLDHYDTHSIRRFDIAFQHECRFGQTVEVRTSTSDFLTQCEIVSVEGERAVAAIVYWKE